MKKTIILGCALIICATGGCSKSKNAKSSAENKSGPNAITSLPGPVDMKIKWNAGKKYSYRMDFDQSTKTDVPNQSRPIVQTVKLSEDFDFLPIKQLDDGGWQLQLTFAGATISILRGEQTVLSFDSTQNAQDTNNPVAAIFGAMMGAHLQYTTDANGKVQKVEGIDELTSRIETTTKPQQQMMFKQMFSEDTLKQYGSFSDSLPDHPVNIGDSWTLNRNIDSTIGTLSVNAVYTFKNWEQHGESKCMHVKTSGDISTKNISTANGAAVEIKNGKITGEFWFDPALGMIVDMNSDQDMTLKVTTRSQVLNPQFIQKIHFALVDTAQ